MSEKFVCSICIPTYNRNNILIKNIESLVTSESFAAGKIEIIISDNFSTDGTEKSIKFFTEKYPEQIKYIKPDTPLDSHFNFENALNNGRGKYLKLQNDYAYFKTQVLDAFINILEQLDDEIDIIIPYNKKQKFSKINNINDLLTIASFNITSINMLCLKKCTYHALQEPFRAWETHFPQVDIIFRLLSSGKQAVCVGDIKILAQPVKYSSSRNNAEIFGIHYVELLMKYMTEGHISYKNFQREKMNLLYRYIIPYHFDFFKQYYTENRPRDFFKYMKYFYKDWFFYGIFFWISFYYFVSNIIPIHQLCGKIKRKFFSDARQ